MFTKYSKIAFKGLTVISVSLDKYKFKVEPTASERVGFHKYPFDSVKNSFNHQSVI